MAQPPSLPPQDMQEMLSYFGQTFAKEYYNRLVFGGASGGGNLKSGGYRHNIAEMYSPVARFTVTSGRNDQSRQERRAEGVENIVALLDDMQFNSLLVRVYTIDIQPSPHFNSVVVLTTGKMGDREFVQTHVVEASAEASSESSVEWKVCARHDLLCFLDDLPIESAAGTRPPAAAAPAPAPAPAPDSAVVAPAVLAPDTSIASAQTAQEPSLPSAAVVKAAPASEPLVANGIVQKLPATVTSATAVASLPKENGGSSAKASAKKMTAPKRSTADRKKQPEGPSARVHKGTESKPPVVPASESLSASAHSAAPTTTTASNPPSSPLSSAASNAPSAARAVEERSGPKSWAQVAQAKQQQAKLQSAQAGVPSSVPGAASTKVTVGPAASSSQVTSKAESKKAAKLVEADITPSESPADDAESRRKPRDPRREREEKPQPDPTDLDKYVFVRGVPKTATEQQIRAIFGRFGEVVSIEFHRNKRYCFIGYPSAESPQKAFQTAGRNAPQSQRLAIGDELLLVEERKPAIGKKAGETDETTASPSAGGFRTRGGSFRGRAIAGANGDGFRGRGSPRSRRGGGRPGDAADQ